MLESLRSEYIARLMEGIARIGPGPMFERFGAKFLDHHLDVTLVHRGLNVQMNPVGRTIDSYDDASRTGAEYSIEQDYFVGQMDKASGDLTHVLEKHPGVVDIYLLSSRKAPEGVIPAYTQRVALWPGMVGRKLHLYDARRIAETIVDDLLLSDAAIDDLVEHLPSLANIIDDAAAALVMPRPDERHLLRPRVDQMIGDELAANGPVVVLSGIGGLGKSDAAIAYAAAHGADYKMLLWIDGERLRRVEDLKAVELWRGGKTRNVEGLMKSRQCLVIIDDSSDAIDRTALARICGLGTHVIVTRRVLAANDLEIPLLDGEEARAILDRDLAEPCPPHVFAQLIETLGGHPLSLALVNRVVADGATWDDIADDCAGVPNLARGDQRLADRLLGRLRPALVDLLQLFEWAAQGTIDLRFLRDAIGALGVARLRQYGLTAPDRPTTLKLHDIVQASVIVQRWLTPERASEFDNRFEAFLESLIAEEGHTLRIVASTMQAKLEALVTIEPRPAFIVALLEIWKPRETRPALLPDPADTVECLAAAGVPPSRAQVRAILETIGGLYRYDKTVDYKSAGDKLRARLPIFERLAAIGGVEARSLTEVRHHRAKAMKILGMDDEAEAAFEEILAGPHPLFASRLQLVRLYGRSPTTVDRAAVLADETLTAASEPGRVSGNVVLAMLQALP